MSEDRNSNRDRGQREPTTEQVDEYAPSNQQPHTTPREQETAHQVESNAGYDSAWIEQTKEALKKNNVQTYIKYNIGIFLAIGLGFGLSLFLTDALGNGGAGGEILLFGFILAFLLGPFIAAITGIVTGLNLHERTHTVGAAAALSALAGFIALVLVMVVVGGIVGGEADEIAGEFIDELLALLGFSLGVAATGYGTAYLTRRFI